MKKILFLLSIFSSLITFFSGCQSSPKIQGSKTEPVYITNSKKFYLLSPKEIPSPFEKQIMFEGEFQKKNLQTTIQNSSWEEPKACQVEISGI